MSEEPRREREELLKAGSGSAVASMRQRARVSRGRRRDSDRRAWRAASLADRSACDGGGDGYLRSLNSEIWGGFEVDCVGILVEAC